MGLCDDLLLEVQAMYSGTVIDFMTSLRPPFEFAECPVSPSPLNAIPVRPKSETV